MPTVADNLRAAGELIARPGGWIKDWYGRKDGYTVITTEEITDAECHCVHGAIWCVTGIAPWLPEHAQTQEVQLMQEVIGIPSGLAEWNDSRTQAEVVVAFRKAAELAEERGL